MKNIALLRWQSDLLNECYGTLKSICCNEIPRKNGKSKLLAAAEAFTREKNITVKQITYEE